MSENLDRLALGTVHTDSGEAVIEPNVPYADLNFNGYSRFKYGDGKVSRQYGAAMARQVMAEYLDMDEREEALYVTSSAYKIARPASTSLVQPFVMTAQGIARKLQLPTRIIPFKINRANLTDGDYADMSAEERSRVMSQNGLTLPAGVDISGGRVVAMDDIRVTGSHEVSLDAVLRENDAAHVTHSYILDVVNGTSDPTLESVINSSAVKDIDDLIAIASLRHFAPNARIGKRILTECTEDIVKFCGAVPLRILGRLIYDASGDGLDEMPRYLPGFNTMLDAIADGLEEPQPPTQ